MGTMAERTAKVGADDIEGLVATAHGFAEQVLRPVSLAYDESEVPPEPELRRAAELGLTSYDLPAEYGGGGVERLTDCIRVIEELTWGCSPMALVISQVGFFAAPVMALGSAEQRARWLPLCTGDEVPATAVAITEPEAGSDAASLATEARRVDGGYVLTGTKKFIGNAHCADLAVVFANVSPGSRSKGITAFVVEHGDPGFRRGERLPKMGSRCFPVGELHLDECFVADDRRLGGEGEGFSGLLATFDRARVQLAANSLGIGRAALELAVAHARERQAFGRRIADFQAVSFRLADVKLKLDQARLLAQRAASLADAGESFGLEAAMAKLAASEAAVFATSACMQTLGGSSYIRDSFAQKWFRDAKLDEIWDGTSDIMRLIIARSLLPR
jgi:acyl-CoA dehydrogenase